MPEFDIGDYVATVIEGPIVGSRFDERGLAYKVRYEDAEGFVRTRWLPPEDLMFVGEDGDDDEEFLHVAVANASLH